MSAHTLCLRACPCFPCLAQSRVDIMDVDMGERPPTVSNVRVLQGVAGDSHVVSARDKTDPSSEC